ncbi:MAG TPA: ABC transporter permease, partial [Acidimicrobiales bacterium]|nr:ABC transporter permease [Acidimicrobiales bacterium]
MKLVRVLAWRRLADRPMRSALTAGGVAVGVAFLFSILSLNAQVTAAARDTAALFDVPRLLQVTPAAPGGLLDGVAPALADDERVEAAVPLLVMRSEVSIDGREAGVFVLAASPESAAVIPQEAMPSMDAIEVSDQGGEIVIGRSLARRLDAKPGDVLTVDASTGEVPLQIAAVADVPQLERINGGMVVGMFLDRAKQVFGRDDRVDQIMVLARQDVDVDALRDDLAERFGGMAV